MINFNNIKDLSKKSLPIGVFDSGMGGLSVLMNLYKLLPNEKYIYLGDTARVPYGSKAKESIIEYSKQCVHFLLEQNVKLIVVACNTASSVAMEAISKVAKDIPVIEMINPATKGAVNSSNNGKIGIIGTKGTIKSEAYIKSLRKLDSFDNLKLFPKACPLFVPLVEESLVDHQVTEIITHEYLDEFKTNGIDTLILGCTHYPFLVSQIVKALPDVNLIDTGYFAALDTQKKLRELSLEADINKENQNMLVNNEQNGDKNILNDVVNSKKITNFDIYSTDSSTDFKNVAESYLNVILSDVKKVDISYY